MTKRKPQKLAPANPPSEKEVAAIQAAARRLTTRRQPVSVNVRTVSTTAPKSVEISPPHDDQAGWVIRLADAFGTGSTAFAHQQLGVLMENSQAGGPVDERRVRSMLAAVDAVQPRDEVEAMLAVQIATTHAFAMDCMRRAAGSENIPQLEANGSMATKMLRTFALQLEALAKLRRGGTQKVTVEHVHIHPGGQAIVGSVQTGGGGGGAIESRSQPHAKGPAFDLSHAPEPTLRGSSPNEGREPVPVAGDAERPLPDARRRLHRRAKG